MTKAAEGGLPPAAGVGSPVAAEAEAAAEVIK